jgi:hypothetical protein
MEEFMAKREEMDFRVLKRLRARRDTLINAASHMKDELPETDKWGLARAEGCGVMNDHLIVVSQYDLI